ncbi:MAG: HAD family phosphatase [Erysipelotrichaceae bacterium]|nr:HAD family phosphatase [Erysipelotrichaceae bacterium]
MIKPKLVIFDVDGLMLDTESQWQKAWQEVGEKHGIQDLGTTTFLKCVGRTGKEVDDIIKEDLGHIENYEAILDEIRCYGRQLLDAHIDAKPGVYEILDYLKDKKYKIAVATATTKDLTYERLSRLHLLDYFDYVLCGSEVQNKKPNPEIYIKVIEHFQIDSTDALVLEDSIVGVEAAYRAHIPCIMVPDLNPAGNKQRNETIAIVTSLYDVIDILRGDDYATK